MRGGWFSLIVIHSMEECIVSPNSVFAPTSAPTFTPTFAPTFAPTFVLHLVKIFGNLLETQEIFLPTSAPTSAPTFTPTFLLHRITRLNFM
jgi:hypothetical protein